MPPSSGSSITAVLLGLLDPEDADTMILQNHGNYLPINMASHPRRLQSSFTVLLYFVTSYIFQYHFQNYMMIVTLLHINANSYVFHHKPISILYSDLQEVESGGMDWIDLAQDRDRWQALVNVVRYLWVPQNAGNFLIS